MAGKAYILFENESTNDTSAPVTLGASGDRNVFLSGTFDGATVTLEMESPNFVGVWMPISDASFTEPMVWHYLKIKDTSNIRAVTTGVGTSSITVEISK